MISDQSATLQKSKVTGDARRSHTSGVDHPRACAYMHVVVVQATHLGGPLPFMAHSDSIDRVPNESREIYFPGIKI